MCVYVCKSPLLYIGDPVSVHASGATIGMAGRVPETYVEILVDAYGRGAGVGGA
jgi:hypothetical protein